MRFLSALLAVLALVVSGAQAAVMQAEMVADATPSHCFDMTGDHQGSQKQDPACMVGGHCDYCPAAAFTPPGAVAASPFTTMLPIALDAPAPPGEALAPAAPPPRA